MNAHQAIDKRHIRPVNVLAIQMPSASRNSGFAAAICKIDVREWSPDYPQIKIVTISLRVTIYLAKLKTVYSLYWRSPGKFHVAYQMSSSAL